LYEFVKQGCFRAELDIRGRAIKVPNLDKLVGLLSIFIVIVVPSYGHLTINGKRYFCGMNTLKSLIEVSADFSKNQVI